MNQQHQNPPFEKAAPTYPMPLGTYRVSEPAPPIPTAWQSTPKAVRFAVWVWAISVIAGLALAAVFMVLFAVGMNLAILGGSQ